MAKEKNDYLEIVPFMKDSGIEVKKVFTANTRVAYDWDKKKHRIMSKNGNKFIMVRCDFVLIEIE